MAIIEQIDVILIELKIPHNSLERTSRDMKHRAEKEAYQQGLSDFETNGFVANLFTSALLITGSSHLEKLF